jgi:ribosomal-protein-alanine N-acetyltransferase
MVTSKHWSIKHAELPDRASISALLSTARWQHQHFDWVSALDLLSESPFLIALERDLVVGCLACPPDPPQVAWLRIFSVAADYSPAFIWDQLWPKATAEVSTKNVRQAAVLLSGEWLAPILKGCGFEHTNDVIFLERRGEAPPTPLLPLGSVRTMLPEDIEAITELDQSAFKDIWQYSTETLLQAYKHAAIATIIEHKEEPLGYQISTASIYGAHLARLAVAPQWQGHGFGTALVVDVINRFFHQGVLKITVNTQTDNEQSLRIYRKLGFRDSGSRHPVYQLQIDS